MADSHSPSLPCPLKLIPQANTSKKKAVVAATTMAKRGGGFVVRFAVDFLQV